MMDTTLQRILTVLFEGLSRLGCAMGGIPLEVGLEPEQDLQLSHHRDKE